METNYLTKSELTLLKQTFVTVILFILTSFNVFSQSNPAPTTEEEYNYLTKGYRVQIESGLDMKKGYEFEDMGAAVPMGAYSFQFKSLIRSAKKEVAAVMVIAKSSNSGRTYYLCIPQGSPDLLNRYYQSIVEWDGQISHAYAKVTSAMFGYLISYGHTCLQKIDKTSEGDR